MTDRDGWLNRFEKSGRPWPALHWLSTLCVIVGTVGALWALPVPSEFHDISPLFNWGSAFLMVTAVYYFVISLSLAIGLLPFLVALSAFELWLSVNSDSSLSVSLILVALGLGGLWLGYRRLGGITAMLVELQHMMLAPAWLLSRVYRRLGIPV